MGILLLILTKCVITFLSLWPSENSFELQVVGLCDCVLVGVHWSLSYDILFELVGKDLFFCNWFSHGVWHTRVGADDG